MKAKEPMDARGAAARALLAVLEQPSRSAEDVLKSAGLEDRDRAFAGHLVYGVLRWLSPLQWLAGQLLRKPLKARDRDVEFLVLVGIFQLWKGGTAPHAAVNETAGATRKLGKPWAAGLVNGVLRNYQRRERGLLDELEQRQERTAHPGWLLEALQKDWPQAWESIVEANNRQPPLWLRVNRQQCTRERYLRLVDEAGLAGKPAPGLAEALQVEPAVPVDRLPGFHQGLVSVQDAAAQWAAEILDAQPGHRVLDACAAPGGKTGHVLERSRDVELLALDRDRDRIGLIRDNLQRLGLQARVEQGDAGEPDGWWDGRAFDRILLDAPCSASGVIRRHPEIKWLRKPEQVDAAVRQQARLLDALWPLLKAGGMLVYATCSVLKRENSQQIINFLDRHGDAALVPIEGSPNSEEPGWQILPGEEDMDGFYYARLQRTA